MRRLLSQAVAVDRETEPWDALLDGGRADGRLVREARRSAPGRRAPSRSRTTCTPTCATRCGRAGIAPALLPPGRGAASAAADGPTIVTTGTASGKSLCFNLPTLDVLLPRRRARGRCTCTRPRRSPRTRRGRCTRSGCPARAPGDLRRRHAARGARGDPQARQRRAHQPRHAARRDPAQPPRLGRLASPTSPWSWSTRRTSTAACSARTSRNVLRRLRRLAAAYGTEPRFLLASRDDRQPGRAGRAPDRASRTSR